MKLTGKKLLYAFFFFFGGGGYICDRLYLTTTFLLSHSIIAFSHLSIIQLLCHWYANSQSFVKLTEIGTSYRGVARQ